MSTYSNRLQLALQNYNLLFGSSTRARYARLFPEPPIYASCMTISGGRTEQLDVAGFLPCHWLYEWFSQFHMKYSFMEPFNSY